MLNFKGLLYTLYKLSVKYIYLKLILTLIKIALNFRLTGEQKDLGALGSTLKGGFHERRETQDVSGVHLDIRTSLQEDVEAFGLSCPQTRDKEHVHDIIDAVCFFARNR